MNEHTLTIETRRAGTSIRTGAAAISLPTLLTALLSATTPTTAMPQEVGCRAGAQLLRYACAADLRDSFFTARAQCLDTAAPDEACTEAAEEEFDAAGEECREIFSARIELCEAVDDAPYEPPFGALFAPNFVDPTQIGNGIVPNPYFPLVAGNRWVYANIDETIVVEVLGETKLIDGITCVTVRDVVTEDDVPVEVTDDWYAQDVAGNVWYCGEISQSLELFDGDDPEIAELVELAGSWKHGRDAAKAGLLLPFAPAPGEVIRQEVKYTDAEDVIEVLSVTATETAIGGSCTDTCLQTRDYTPLDPDPDSEEEKFYAPGIGLIVEVKPSTGDRLELIEFVGVGQ